MQRKKEILEKLIRKEKLLIKHCMVNDWLIAKEQHEALVEKYIEELEKLKEQTSHTGHHFLSIFNDEQRLAFIDNYLDISSSCKEKKIAVFTLSEFLEGKYENMLEFIASAFEWPDTKEGSKYWADITLYYINH